MAQQQTTNEEKIINEKIIYLDLLMQRKRNENETLSY